MRNGCSTVIRIPMLAVTALLLALTATPAHAVSWTQTFQFGGVLGSAAGQFNNPIGLDVAADDGSIWVADGSNDRIQRFTADGTAPSVLAAGMFSLAEDVLVTPKVAYASDCYGKRIISIDRGNKSDDATAVFYDGTAQRTSADPTLLCPESLRLGPDGNIWVADTFHNRVVAISPSGQFLRAFGTGLDTPGNLAFDQNGKLVVSSADPHTCKLTKLVTFEPTSGAVLSTFGGIDGQTTGKLFCINALDIDNAGNVFVGDATGRVQVWNAAHEYAGLVTPPGGGSGSTTFPMDIAVAADCNSFLVMDRDQRQVKRFSKFEPTGCVSLPTVGIDPGPDPLPAGSGATPAAAPEYKLATGVSVKPRLKVNGRFVLAIVRCGGTATCAFKVSGELKIGAARATKIAQVSKRIAPGSSSSVTLKLTPKQKTAVTRALKRGVKVAVTFKGTVDGKAFTKTSTRLVT